ncbi:ribosome biogenesis protein tsr1 [Flagelloscypha sp. PMI_526]|nr:ribosome biogenesis protein tsr1 [Flagelloscypha sp. PMI_526]
MSSGHHHRPTLKQQNKAFKSKHATKSSIREAAKGKIARASPKSTSSHKSVSQSKLNRRNHAKQIQAQRRQSVVDGKRFFSGVDGTPRTVAVIPLTPDEKASARKTVAAIARALDMDDQDIPEEGLWRMSAQRFKTSLQFWILPYRKLYSSLDAAKVSDYVIFSLSPNVEVDKWGDTLLRTLQSQGLPDTLSIVPSSSSSIIKSLLSFMQYFYPDQSRVYDLTTGGEMITVARKLCEGTPGGVKWRDSRNWILGEETSFSEDGELKVTGYVKGSVPFSANRLVHLPGYGDFQVSKVVAAPIPTSSRKGMDIDPASTHSVLAEPVDSDADSLVSSNEPDDMANEQTWPTEEDMASAPALGNGQDTSIPDVPVKTTKRKRIPKGWSKYQASWIIDSDSEDDEGDDGMKSEEDDDEEFEDDTPVIQEDEHDGTAMDTATNEEDDELPDMDEEEMETWRNSRKTRESEEQEDAEFPDEMDTPKDLPARERFARFRGLRSFRTSPWDPYESLPRDYARIFQFEDFKRTERRAFDRDDEQSVQPGTRVTVHIKNVPSTFPISSTTPTTLFGLLIHEHKVSVLNFTVQRNTEYTGIVRSKDPLILCVGPRRLSVNPVYSQNPNNTKKPANNVYKFERFLRHGGAVGTIYGPVTFGSGRLPCTLLRESSTEGDVEAPELVGSGTFLNCDTTRIVAKRVVLTGHPFKVHKRTATVRWMFFNSDDIAYFKPIQLHTKYGKVGHIKESLGTHGYYKAHFDGPINQMDTICMSLYKRMFPRWATVWGSERKSVANGNGEDVMMEE